MSFVRKTEIDEIIQELENCRADLEDIKQEYIDLYSRYTEEVKENAILRKMVKSFESGEMIAGNKRGD